MTMADTRGSTAGFEPIELDELLALAALQDRVDRKYVLPVAALTPILAALQGRARMLQIDGRRGFDYESVYFDTPDVVCYRQAALRRRRRFKIRTRTYLNSAERWLEVKTRDHRGHTVKQRQEHRYDAVDLPETAREFIDHVVVGAELPGTWDLSLVPTLTTTYRRRTLFLPGSASRVTVDTDLRWATADRRDIDLPGVAIIETKTATTRPCEADRLLWRAGCRPSLISKYGTGLAALRPDLPSNKWHRVLNRYFWSAS